MKYIEKYICSLSDDVSIIKSEKSQSVYITLDGGFKIRLSDHHSVKPCVGSTKMDIISIFKSKDFLFFTDAHIPMVKSREELKCHIKVTYENWAMNRMKVQSDNNCASASKKIRLKDCITESDFIKLITEERLYEGDIFCNRLCNMKQGIRIPVDVRRFITALVNDKKITGAKMLYIIKENTTPIHDINDVKKLLNGIVEFD